MGLEAMIKQKPLRATEMSLQQRDALQQARRILAPHFAGESVRMYVPRQLIEQKIEREQQVRESLLAGLPLQDIARAQGITVRYVRCLRARLGTCPP